MLELTCTESAWRIKISDITIVFDYDNGYIKMSVEVAGNKLCEHNLQMELSYNNPLKAFSYLISLAGSLIDDPYVRRNLKKQWDLKSE